METSVILLSFILTVTQLFDAYLRYLAFRDGMDKRERNRLWRFFFAWGLLDGALLYCWLFHSMGITAAPYKAVLMLGWIPYLVIFMSIVRGQAVQHIFVFGMSAVWGFLQHNWSSIAVALFLKNSPEEVVLMTHASLYLLWSFLAWPLERRLFSNLIPSKEFFALRPLGIYIALLPLIILSGHLLLLADGRLWHSWTERLSRIYLPLVFFFFYRYILIASKKFYSEQRADRNSQLLRGQLSSLEGYSRLMQKNDEQVSVLRRDIGCNYRIIRDMLEKGELSKARKMVTAELSKLKNTQIVSYSNSRMLNIALSLYISRAEEMGCSVKAQVDLADNRLTSENDLSMLLSNILLRAATAAKTKNRGKGEIIFTLRIAKGKGTLHLMNRHEEPFPLDKNGWPLKDSDIDEHELGMLSLIAFVKKYGAKASFWQKDGWVRLSISWEDRSL